MDFSFSDEQIMIRDTAEQFLAEVSDSAAVRAVMASERGYDDKLWARICQDMYWQAITVPEACGGLDLGYIELVAVLEQMGRRLACTPLYASVCLAANTLLVAGSDAQQQHWLGRLVAGEAGTLAFSGPSANWDAASVSLNCVREGKEFILNGESRYVPDGHSADIICVAARETASVGDAGVSLFIMDASTYGLSREWLPTMDQTRKQAQLTFSNVRVSADALLGEQGAAAQHLETVLD
ncbi:MAG: acyl-CoA/acyl-ACP dehydrogenase, partial [Gammaproteobacteria bacterium]|nr:acyl-CoA/acyl-ACP dehydrogenase [Gammaproteobacteria bacterium]